MSRTTQHTTMTDTRYHATWNDTTALYDTIVETVATATNTARSTVEAQYDPAHARSLRDLFDAKHPVPATGVVKFVVAACTVTVHSDGRLVVEPSSPAPETSS